MSMVRAVHVDTLMLAEIRTTNTNALQVLKQVDGGTILVSVSFFSAIFNVNFLILKAK